MKEEIHPELNNIEVTCNTCNTKFTTESTKAGFKSVEVCSKCHPFYTGKQKSISKGGRIDRFNAKYSSAAQETQKTGTEEK
ncbi:MAG TPA: 50S ribosomal protein L31 [Clostridiales bacterium]|nr:MAG: 50S ribosomal protein L31 [Clostridiales bacterium GWD2_32_19]HCC07535.1 50S ribosomal protein L31 [Clostridiales bacterium]